MLAALNRHTIWSADYNWLKSQEVNQEVLSQPALGFQSVLRKFLKSFRWARKRFFADWSEYCTQELVNCIRPGVPTVLRSRSTWVPRNVNTVPLLPEQL